MKLFSILKKQVEPGADLRVSPTPVEAPPPRQPHYPFERVQQEELTAISAVDPHVKQESLVGLGFSGGGIRSATFGLGVLEALKQEGLLDKLHYLSTVSGGGYIGAWLSANCLRAVERGGEPDWRSTDADWSESIRHLRRYSNYLSPDVGFFSADTWSMFTIWLRNALLVQLTVAVCIACVLLVPRLAGWLFGVWPVAGNFRWIAVALFILGVVGIAGNLQAVSRANRIWLLQVQNAWVGVLIALGLVAVAIIYSLAFDFWPFASGTINPLHSAVVALLLVLAGYFVLAAGVWLYARTQPEATRPTQVNYAQRHVQWFIVAPMLLSGFFVGAILWHLRTEELSNINQYSALFLQARRVWPFPLAVVFVSLVLLAICSIPNRRAKNILAAALAAGVSVLVLHALLCAIVLLLHNWRFEQMQHAFVLAPALVLDAFSLTIVVLIGIVGRQSTEGVREWWSRLGAWLLIYGAAWMTVAVAAVYGPTLVYTAFTEHFWTSLSSLGGWVGTVIAGLAAGHSDKTGREDGRRSGNPVARFVALVAPFLFIVGLLIGVATLIDLVVQANTGGRSWGDLWAAPSGWTTMLVSAVMLAACLGTALLLGLRIDINEFSLNAFYRNRLVRCFLGATRVPNANSQPAPPPRPMAAPGPPPGDDEADPWRREPQYFTGFDDDDDLPLAALGSRDRVLKGPLHLVNCALNLGGSGDLSLHTRHSAAFTLSPLHAGSHYRHSDDGEGTAFVDYVPTADYGGDPRATTVGKAISVSGAAASPNMGYHTSPVVAFLLTVFNLRLGWWFPNPGQSAARAAPRFNLGYMFAELFGGATYRSRFLMVSDGGHFENLGLYELVKRKCAVIIASDAECDPKLVFEGLGTLIRMCDVDLDAKIRIDVDSLRPRDGSAWSDQRCAVGTIDYGGGLSGTLIYLKAAMTGLEPTALLQYKASHPTFPHESTGDQFYSEDQFESYRRLGFDVASRAFDAALAALSAAPAWTMLDLAATIAKTSAPTLAHVGNFTAHSRALMGLWDKMKATAALKPLDVGMLGEAFAQVPEGTPREEVYTCVEMIQLMENVYLDLRLDDTWDHADHRGWQELFKIWAASTAIQRTWKTSSRLFGVRFQYFCRRRLGL